MSLPWQNFAESILVRPQHVRGGFQDLSVSPDSAILN